MSKEFDPSAALESKSIEANESMSGLAPPAFQLHASAPIQRQEGGNEPWAQIMAVGPIDAARAKRDADHARAAAQNSGLPGLWNGPADAFRHAYWNALMVQSIGAEQAREVADIHEEMGANHPHEHTMDYHNNAQGRIAGAAGGDAHSAVMAMLNSGQLLVIPNFEAVAQSRGQIEPEAPVPSGSQSSSGAQGTDPYTYGNSGYGGY